MAERKYYRIIPCVFNGYVFPLVDDFYNVGDAFYCLGYTDNVDIQKCIDMYFELRPTFDYNSWFVVATFIQPLWELKYITLSCTHFGG